MERQKKEEKFNCSIKVGDRVCWLEHDSGFEWEAYGTVIEVKADRTRVFKSYRYTQQFHKHQLQGIRKMDVINTEKLEVLVKNNF